MSDFDQKFIENPQFLRWIFQNNPDINQYWERYILDHPEEVAKIVELKDRLEELNFPNELLLNFEKEDLSQKIINRINQDLNHNQRSKVLSSFLKYASVALIFAVLGGLVVYYGTKGDSVYDQLAGQMVHIPLTNQGPVLITSNGDNFDLENTNSSVDHTHVGSVVLNNNSVIRLDSDGKNVLNQLVIPYGNQSKVLLSDSTIVWLNAGSHLIYPSVFNDDTREVMLFGEAYFEVAKNPEKPFIVKTSDLDIKVLGTKFNVSAYAEDNVIQTVLAEGSVEIKRNNHGFFSDEMILKPNQLASFNKKTHESKTFEVDASYYTIWIQGLLSFDEIDFNRIVKKVERFYNIKIRFDEPIVGSIRISGKLDLKQSKEEVLEYLEKVSVTNIEKLIENQYLVKK